MVTGERAESPVRHYLVSHYRQRVCQGDASCALVTGIKVVTTRNIPCAIQTTPGRTASNGERERALRESGARGGGSRGQFQWSAREKWSHRMSSQTCRNGSCPADARPALPIRAAPAIDYSR